MYMQVKLTDRLNLFLDRGGGGLMKIDQTQYVPFSASTYRPQTITPLPCLFPRKACPEKQDSCPLHWYCCGLC